jgi:hypothetical protein
MQTTSKLIRRLLGLLIVPAALAMPLVAAPAAWAQDEEPAAGAEAGGDEEDFYRQSDPEEPTGPAAKPPAPKVYTISLSLRGLNFLDATSDLEVERISMGVQGQWLWSPLDKDNAINWEIGAEIGYQPFTSFSEDDITPTQWVGILADTETGIEQLTIDHSKMFIAIDVTTMYFAVANRIDFMGPSPWDVGASLSLGYALSQVEAEWNCKQCDGTNPTNGGGDADLQHLYLRIGGFASYQFEWFNIGFDLGLIYWTGDDVPATMAIDFGLAFGVQF